MKRVTLRTMWVVVMAVDAIGDGGYFPRESGDLAQARQEVAMILTAPAGGTPASVTYVLRSRYSGNVDEFAWVIPTPTTPTNITAQPTDGTGLLDRLGSYAPTFLIVSRSGGMGCACSGPDLSDATPRSLVEVQASGRAGIFEWTALTSTGSTALLNWLNGNGYALPPGTDGLLAGYIQENWHFLALRIAQQATASQPAGGQQLEIPAIQFTCATSERVYPLTISRVSAADQTEIIIYVIAGHRAASANVPNLTIAENELALAAGNPSGTTYETLFAAKIAAAGGLALVTEYAAPLSAGAPLPAPVPASGYLTRMRTAVARERMDRDLIFADAASDAEQLGQFVLYRSDRAAAGVGAAAAVGLLAWLGLKRFVAARRHPRAH